MGLILIEPPQELPVSRDDAVKQLRLDADLATAEADYLDSLIAAAVAHIQVSTRRSMAVQTWEMTFDGFPCEAFRGLELDMPPLREIVSVKYYDADGVQQTLASDAYYAARAGQGARKGLLLPKPSSSWPVTQSGRLESVAVQFTAGYETDEFPAGIKQLMLVQLSLWYESRIPVDKVPGMLDDLLSSYSLYTF